MSQRSDIAMFVITKILGVIIVVPLSIKDAIVILKAIQIIIIVDISICLVAIRPCGGGDVAIVANLYETICKLGNL